MSDHARMALCGRHIAQPDHEVLVESNSKDWPHSQQRSLKLTMAHSQQELRVQHLHRFRSLRNSVDIRCDITGLRWMPKRIVVLLEVEHLEVLVMVM